MLELAGTLNDDKLKQFEDALSDAFTFKWKQAYEIWIQPTNSNPDKAEAVWNMYAVLELDGNLEQKLLKKALRELNTELRRIYKECLPRQRKKSQKPS